MVSPIFLINHTLCLTGVAEIDVPQLKKLQSYDPFKVDVFTVGNVFFKDLYEVFVPSFALLIRQIKRC